MGRFKLIAFVVGLVLLAFAGAYASSSIAPEAALATGGTGTDCVPTADGWQRYSWTGGPHESDDPPAFPSEDWQANVAGDPHGIGVEGAYFVSHGNAGLGDWFYLERVEGVDCPPPTTTDEEPPCEETLAGQMLGCEPPVDPPGDICKNLGGVQTTVPVGYIMGTDFTCFPEPDPTPPAKHHRHDPPGTVIGDCVVQPSRELLCGEQG